MSYERNISAPWGGSRPSPYGYYSPCQSALVKAVTAERSLDRVARRACLLRRATCSSTDSPRNRARSVHRLLAHGPDPRVSTSCWVGTHWLAALQSQHAVLIRAARRAVLGTHGAVARDFGPRLPCLALVAVSDSVRAAREVALARAAGGPVRAGPVERHSHHSAVGPDGHGTDTGGAAVFALRTVHGVRALARRARSVSLGSSTRFIVPRLGTAQRAHRDDKHQQPAPHGRSLAKFLPGVCSGARRCMIGGRRLLTAEVGLRRGHIWRGLSSPLLPPAARARSSRGRHGSPRGRRRREPRRTRPSRPGGSR